MNTIQFLCAFFAGYSCGMSTLLIVAYAMKNKK